MVSVPMHSGPFLRLSCLALIASLSAGCLSRKNDQAATPAESPPPAAYPESHPGYADTNGVLPATAPAPYQREVAAPREPEPFELRADEQLVEHRIQSGETLTSIAAEYDTRISRIQAANGMTNTTIYAGKSLKVPVRKEAGMASFSTPSAPGSLPAAPGGGAGSYSAGRFGVAPAPSQPTHQGPAGGSYASNRSSSASIAPPITPPVTAPDPASTSYPRVTTPAVPPAPSQPEEAFPTPSFGGFR